MIIYVPPFGKDPLQPKDEDENKDFYKNMTTKWNMYRTEMKQKNSSFNVNSFINYLKENDTCIIVWGRFQPPHKGHGKLFDTAVVLGDEKYKTEILGNDPTHVPFGSLIPEDDMRLADFLNTPDAAFLREGNADVFIMPTSTCKDKTGECRYPFNLLQKFKLLEMIYPNDKYRFTYLNQNNLDKVISIFSKIYTNMVIVCGGDSDQGYNNILKRYFKEPEQYSIAYAPVGTDRFSITLDGNDMNLSASLIRMALQLCLDDIVKYGITPDTITKEDFNTNIKPVLIDAVIEKYGKEDTRKDNCDAIVQENGREKLEEMLKDYAMYLQQKEQDLIVRNQSLKRKASSSFVTEGGSQRFLFIKSFMKKLYRV